MANVKITELTAATALAGTDVLPIVDVGADATKKVSVSDLLRNLPDGTASAPALAFADDQNTGVLSPGDNSLAFATNATQRLVINSAGQIDINSNCRIEEDGLFKASNGSAAAPSHAFLNDPDNGMFRATTNTLGFSTGGSERLRIDSSGRVGVGTTSPSRSLQVSGSGSQYAAVTSTTSANAGIVFGDSSDDDAGYVLYANSVDALLFGTGGATERMRIDSSGRLLLGTTTEGSSNADDFTVANSGNGGITIRTGTSSSGQIAFSDGTSGSDELRGQILYNHSSNYMRFQTDATERMRIDSSGNVGIGTTSPSGLLHVSGQDTSVRIQTSAGTLSDMTNDTHQRIAFQGGNAELGLFKDSSGNFSYVLGTNQGSTDIPLVFRTSSRAERMRIDSSGNIGIAASGQQASYTDYAKAIVFGTSSETTLGLVFRTGTSGTGSIAFADNSGSGSGAQDGLIEYSQTNRALAFSTAASERLRIDSSGRVGIGTSAPWSDLTVGAGGTANPASTTTIHKNTHSEFRLKLTSSDFNADGRWLGLGFGYSDNYLKSAIIAEAKDGNARTNLHLCTEGNSNSTNVGLSNSRMVVTYDGNVGIGTSSPSSILHLEDSDNTVITLGNSSYDDGVIQYYNGSVLLKTGSSSGDRLMTFSTAGSERMRIDSSGRLLFGTTSAVTAVPTGESDEPGFQISKANKPTSIALYRNDTSISSGNTLGGIHWYGNDTTSNTPAVLASMQVQADDDHAAGDNPTRITLSTTADGASSVTERLRIDSSGRVGIGNTAMGSLTGNAANNLVVGPGSGNAGLTVYTGTGNYGSLTFADGTSGDAQYRGFIMYHHNGDSMRFNTAASERMRIDSSGLVGIANTNPQTLLSLLGGYQIGWNHATNGTKYAEIYADTSSNLIFRNTNSQTERMRIDSSGAVLINRTSKSDDEKLGVRYSPVNTGIIIDTDASFSGNSVLMEFKANGTTGGSIAFTNNGTTTAYVTSSDYRLKENVVDLADGITRVKQLQPRRFNFIADADTTVDGFVAHEAQAVVPEAVTGAHNEVDDDGNAVMQGIDQSKLVPLLTAALQEAIAKIETLETKVAALEAQ